MIYFKNMSMLTLLAGFIFTTEALSAPPDENLPLRDQEPSKNPPVKPALLTEEDKAKAKREKEEEKARFRAGAYKHQQNLRKKRRGRHF
jgi:hypothetical protein